MNMKLKSVTRDLVFEVEIQFLFEIDCIKKNVFAGRSPEGRI